MIHVEDIYSKPSKTCSLYRFAGSVKTSIIAEGCMIYGKCKKFDIFPGVYIEEGAVIEDSIIMSNSRVGGKKHSIKRLSGENGYRWRKRNNW